MGNTSFRGGATTASEYFPQKMGNYSIESLTATSGKWLRSSRTKIPHSISSLIEDHLRRGKWSDSTLEFSVGPHFRTGPRSTGTSHAASQLPLHQSPQQRPIGLLLRWRMLRCLEPVPIPPKTLLQGDQFPQGCALRRWTHHQSGRLGEQHLLMLRLWRLNKETAGGHRNLCEYSRWMLPQYDRRKIAAIRWGQSLFFVFGLGGKADAARQFRGIRRNHKDSGEPW